MTSIVTLLEQTTITAIQPEVVDESLRFLGIKLLNFEDFAELLFRFSFNMVISLVLVRYLYYSVSRRKDYLFTYIMISATVFLLCFLLENVKLELGFALGLFAIFAIIRYRTNPIPIKEMTYLFVVIGISVINALANKKICYSELVFTNIVILGLVYGMERLWLLKHESSKVIIYERIDLIKPERYTDLITDLKERTGLQIKRAEIGRVDFLQDTAQVKVYYFSGNINMTDMENQNMPL